MGSLYSVIVLCHNHLETTKRCLDALFRTDLSKARIIVVDNGSTDGTGDYLAKNTHRLMPIVTGTNEGVGAGYNIGFRFTDTEFFVTLNNDILIHESDWLNKLHAPFTDPTMALVGVEGTPSWLDPLGMGHPLAEAIAYFKHPVDADYVQTSCMMGLTIAAMHWGALFDAAFKFSYCEDSDLSLRLRSVGWKIAHIPLNVEHIGGVTLQDPETTGAKDYYVANHLLLQKRWGKYLETKKF